MTLCPIAIAVGCKKCPIFAVCPVKGIIGDYKKEDDAPAKPAAGNSQAGEEAQVACRCPRRTAANRAAACRRGHECTVDRRAETESKR